MKLFHLILLLVINQSTIAQCIFEYEQEITISENLQIEEISFVNKEDNIRLSGTLISPKAEFDKIVMIVPGSGKDTRNSHFILSQEFLNNNIAVYRFDERGVGKSEGKYNYTATSLMTDLIYAFHSLRKMNELSNKKIGILGHSLGGIASIGAYSKECEFDFLIQMATPVENNGAFIKYQARTNTDGFYTVKNKSTSEVVNFIDEISKSVKETDNYKTSKSKANKIMKRMGFRKGNHIVNPLIIDLMKQNHEETYQNSKIPILYIIGTEDRIVSSTNEITALNKMNNSMIDIKVVENVNHWLSEKIAPTKMEKSLYNMNKKAIYEIVKWTLEK